MRSVHSIIWRFKRRTCLLANVFLQIAILWLDQISARPLGHGEILKHFASMSSDHLATLRTTLKHIVRLTQHQYFGKAFDDGNVTWPSPEPATQSTDSGPSLKEYGHRRPSAADVLATQTFNSPLSRVLFEGDILLTPKQADSILESVIGILRRDRRAVLDSLPGGRWKEFPILYNFHKSLGQGEIADVTAAINFWQQHTCLTFQYEANPGSHDYLEFYKGNGCYSMIGEIGGKQGVSIGEGCSQLGVITHEIGHALGLWHEQSRPDASQFVRIRPEHIIPSVISNFLRRDWKDVTLFDIPYDFGSVMHYGPQSFVNDWNQNSIETLDPGFQATIGSRIHPSFYDVKMMNKAYCENVCSKAGGLNCLYGGYANPLSCRTCICPDGLGGRQCEAPAQSVNGNCGGVIYASSDWTELASPGYPKTPYDPNVECNWIIRTQPGTKVLLEFTELFQFYCSRTCLDFVEIKTARDFGNTGMRFCCEAPSHSFLSETNEMLVLMRTTSGGRGVGFKARVRQDPMDASETSEAATDTSTIATTLTSVGQETSLVSSTADFSKTTIATLSTTALPITVTTSEFPTTTTASTSAASTSASTTTTTATAETSTTELQTKPPATSRLTIVTKKRKRKTTTTLASTTDITTTTQPPETAATTTTTTTTSTTSAAEAFSEWTVWSECSKPCGACGLKFRSRECLLAREQDCQGDTTEFKRCNMEPCSARTGTEICVGVEQYDFPCGARRNSICSDPKTVTFKCSLPYCCAPFRPVNGRCSVTDKLTLRHAEPVGLWTPWGDWGPCKGPPCGGCALQTRLRQCSAKGKCRGEKREQRRCNLDPCADCTAALYNLTILTNKSIDWACPCCPPLKLSENEDACVFHSDQ